MKAVIWTEYGPPEVLKLKEVEKPVPADNEVLIKIHSATVTAGDCEIRSLKIALGLGFFMRIYNGIGKPERITILGQEFSGTVEETGKTVTKLKAGDQVFGTTGPNLGAYAEYICLPVKGKESLVAEKPLNMSFEEAAAVPTGGLEALHYLRTANIRKGSKLLINGAGGSIGTSAIQLAKYFGAVVTAVDTADKLEMMRSLGADSCIDYTKENFTRQNKKYDIIFDVVGKGSYSGCMRSLNNGGYYLMANPSVYKILRGILTKAASSRKVIFITSERTTEDLFFLKKLIEDGKFKTVIDRTYPLEKTADAHKYAEKGLKKGNIIINTAR